MRARKKPEERREQEPMGIVISSGVTRETPPLISAYVWGPAPEQPRPAPEPHAA